MGGKTGAAGSRVPGGSGGFSAPEVAAAFLTKAKRSRRRLRLLRGTQCLVTFGTGCCRPSHCRAAPTPCSLLAGSCGVTFIGVYLCRSSCSSSFPVLAGRQLCAPAPCKMSSASRAEQAAEPGSEQAAERAALPARLLLPPAGSPRVEGSPGPGEQPSGRPCAHPSPLGTGRRGAHSPGGPSPRPGAGLPFAGSPLPSRCAFIPRPGSWEGDKPRSEQRPGPISTAQLRLLEEQLAGERRLAPAERRTPWLCLPSKNNAPGCPSQGSICFAKKKKYCVQFC